MERPNSQPIPISDPPIAGSTKIEPAPTPAPFGSLLPTASADELLSLIAQGKDASDLNTLINDAA